MNWNTPRVYAAKHKNEKIRASSRSGGVFTALSDYVLNRNGCIYGCVLNNNFKAVHIKAGSYSERNGMRGSKYVQSDLGDTFSSIESDLKNKKLVLFSGTSCQIAGLKSYLKNSFDNLITIDIVCHGVPSPLVWEKYIKWQEKRKKASLTKVDFRNKIDYGWAAHIESLWFSDGTKIDSTIYTKMFYEHSILRPCCYKCPYKSISHPGDITIGDYWGVAKSGSSI